MDYSGIASAMNVSEDYNNPTSWNDYYDQWQKIGFDNGQFGLRTMGTGGNSIVDKFANFFTGKVDAAKADYDAYLQRLNRAYELDKIASANAYNTELANTQYQRAVADMEKAGLNPMLMFASGISGAGSPTYASGQTSSRFERKKIEQTKEVSSMISSALMLAALLIKKG